MSAYTIALALLGRRELSTRQLRDRLKRRDLPAADINHAIDRLAAAGVLDDRRVAAAAARTAASVKRHGRSRVLRHLRQIGIDDDTARAAVNDVFGQLDEQQLLDAALVRRLRERALGSLDAKERQRVARHLIARGFAPDKVLARLRVRDDE